MSESVSHASLLRPWHIGRRAHMGVILYLPPAPERNGPPLAEPGGVLVMLCVTLLLFGLGIYAIAKVAQQAMGRLGLDLLSILLWLGLAERPIEPGPPRRA